MHFSATFRKSLLINVQDCGLRPKMVKNLKIFAVSRKKLFVPEIKLKIFDI